MRYCHLEMVKSGCHQKINRFDLHPTGTPDSPMFLVLLDIDSHGERNCEREGLAPEHPTSEASLTERNRVSWNINPLASVPDSCKEICTVSRIEANVFLRIERRLSMKRVILKVLKPSSPARSK